MIKRVYGAHPVMIFGIMKPFLFVLILPVIKGVLQYLLTRRITGILTLELFAAATLLLFAYLAFRAFKVIIDGKRLIVEKGFLRRTVAVISRERISSVTESRNIADLLFGSVTYRVNTEAGRQGKPDFSFKLRDEYARELSQFLYGEGKAETVSFPALKTALFAAATSSAVTGITVGVPVINNLGRLLGVALGRMFFSGINRASSRFDAYFPPAVNIITGVIIAGYAASFLITFLKMLAFRLCPGKEKTEVRYGIAVRRRTVFKKSAVNDLCAEQTPLTRCFRMCSLRVSVGGYGDRRGEKSIILPAASRGEISGYLNEIFGYDVNDGQKISPARTFRALSRFLRPAKLCGAANIVATAVLLRLLPGAASAVMLAGALMMAAIVYYGDLCRRNCKKGGLSMGETVFAAGNAGLTVRELYCKKEKIGEIKITRTPADRVYGTCKVRLTVRSESADRIRVLNVDYKKTALLIKNCYLNDE